MILGAIRVTTLMWIYIPICVLTPFYCYYMAVYRQLLKPFPHQTITQTACHYPQDIVFRYTMLIASSIMALTFYIIFHWIKYQAIRVGYPCMSKIELYISQFAILLYGITIGTIDGKGTGSLHSPCAVSFFIILMMIIIRITLYLTAMRNYDTTIMSRKSLLFKQILALYISIVWIYCLIKIITDSLELTSDQYIVIVQWNSVPINLLWLLTFIMEWKNFNLTLISLK